MRLDDLLPDDVGTRVDRARRVAVRATDRLAASPVVVTAVLASLCMAYAAYRLFEPLPAGTWPRLKDSVIFEHIGWYLTEGNRLYVDVWEIKPPLPFEIPALLALLTGDNVALYHVLNVLVTVAALVLGAAGAAAIVFHLTDDAFAAVVGGLATFTLPFYFYRALIGFKPKYFVVAAGLWSLYFAYRDRPALSGIAAAAAIGFWQMAIVFPVAALGLTIQTGGRERARPFVVAGVVTGAIILLPVVLWGAVPAMIAEVLITPLLVSESSTLAGRVQSIAGALGLALPVAIIGLCGLVSGAFRSRFRREWPLLLAVGWFTVQLLLFDYDFLPDLFPWFAVVGVGVGLAVTGRLRVPWPGQSASVDAADDSGSTPVLAVAVLVLVLVSVGTMGGYGTGDTRLTNPTTYDRGTQLDPVFDEPGQYDGAELQYVFWNRVDLPSCRAFGAATQRQLVNRLGIAEDRAWYWAPCGQIGPAWRALLEKFG